MTVPHVVDSNDRHPKLDGTNEGSAIAVCFGGSRPHVWRFTTTCFGATRVAQLMVLTCVR